MMIEGAPKLVDFIEDDSRAHFEGLQTLLADAGLAYEINTRLVRGLDYYNRTVFEWVATSDELGGQGTVAGGGRYDALFEILGGKRNFACGFAIGVERMILLLAAAGATAAAARPRLRRARRRRGARSLRAGRRAPARCRPSIVVNAGGGSMKSQMKRADASAARYALIIGDDEAATDTVAVKPLREAGGQTAVAARDLAAHLATLPAH